MREQLHFRVIEKLGRRQKWVVGLVTGRPSVLEGSFVPLPHSPSPFQLSEVCTYQRLRIFVIRLFKTVVECFIHWQIHTEYTFGRDRTRSEITGSWKNISQEIMTNVFCVSDEFVEGITTEIQDRNGQHKDCSVCGVDQQVEGTSLKRKIHKHPGVRGIDKESLTRKTVDKDT